MPAFHEVRFPPSISYGAVGGPTFRTTIFTRNSGFEDRNVEWTYARAEYDVAMGIKTQAEFEEVRAFFFARRGRAYGFRFKDWADYKSCNAVTAVSALDQALGVSDGSTRSFPTFKLYADGVSDYVRPILKLVPSKVRVAVGSVEVSPLDFHVDADVGVISVFSPALASSSVQVSCGYEFDVPVRFNTDQMLSTLEHYNVHSWGQIPLVEVKQYHPTMGTYVSGYEGLYGYFDLWAPSEIMAFSDRVNLAVNVEWEASGA